MFIVYVHKFTDEEHIFIVDEIKIINYKEICQTTS